MKALRVEDGILRLTDIAKPKEEGESLIRILKSGICNTDLEIIRGYAGFSGTLGHEFVGVVEESADVPDFVGKRVVGEINVGCTVCDWCINRDARHCPKRTVMGIIGRDGCHAEYMTLPTRNLLEVPDGISEDEAIFAEPLAAAYGITEQVSINSGTKVAVIGDGKLGILCAWSLATKTKELFLIGKHLNKLAVAEKEDVEGVLLSDVGKFDRSFDVVVEASGSETGFATALGLLKPRGKLVLKSTFQGKSDWEAWRVVVDEITIVGSRCGMFSPAIDLIMKRRVDVKRLISDEFSFPNALDAIEAAKKPGALKVVMSMNN